MCGSHRDARKSDEHPNCVTDEEEKSTASFAMAQSSGEAAFLGRLIFRPDFQGVLERISESSIVTEIAVTPKYDESLGRRRFARTSQFLRQSYQMIDLSL